MKTLPLLILAAVASGHVQAAGRTADVSVLDRDTGETLRTYYHRGEYWVAGRPGANYAIRVENRRERRLLAVVSVDGVNVLTGETAGIGQRGYEFDAYTGYDIAGWRKSDAQIAAFTFTAVPRSYAARTGRPDHVGVIGVALFRERAAPQVEPPAPVAAPSGRSESTAADSAASAAAEKSERFASDSQRQRAAAPALGTGHGRRESSYVTQVAFERASPEPDEVIRIRYDSSDNLVALGVIRRAPPSRGPLAFPDDARVSYVPDP